MDKNKIKKAKKQARIVHANLQLYASFFPHLFLLESTLKNRLFNLLKKELGADWFTHHLETSGDPLFDQEKEYITRRKPKGFHLKDTGLLVESGLGFWVEFFNRRLYKDSKGLPIQIFENLPKQINRKDIYTRLNRIKEFRNQLVHSRIPPIISKTHIERLKPILQTARELEEILEWLDGLPPEITNTKEIKEKAKKLRKQLEE